MPEWVLFLIFFLPLSTGLLLGLSILVGLNRGEAGERFTSAISLISTGIVLLSLAGTLIYSLIYHWPGLQELYPWFVSGELKITLVLLLDPLSITVANVFCLLLMTAMYFSVFYLHREAGYQRFFMFLNLFLEAILLITLSGNAFTAFVGWELAGLCSFMLIAYAYDRPTSSTHAVRVFIINRIGDAGFILSLVLSSMWLGDTNWSSINENMRSLSPVQSSLIMSGFVLAALVKSAQVPFSSWITRALEGPTPSSAIFYGSLLVHAGVFLLLRLQGAVDSAEGLKVMIFILAGLTLLYGWLCGLVQTDIKTALIMSTIAQVALMFIAIAAGWYLLAVIHMLVHALWRMYQMLSAPSFNHLVSRPARSVPAWLQHRKLLLTAALQRFWLDHVADWLIVRPVYLFARDIRQFDERIVNRIVGLSAQVNALTSFTEYKEFKRGNALASKTLTGGRGILGAVMEPVASMLQWFEEKLVLQGSGEGLVNVLLNFGRSLQHIDELLSEPRYLWLIILITMIIML
ncbi:MAG TPA: proton-conducting transporter membrane subunit [Thermodesulfovibrionia bacterium]|nr:proton-conducting transporter membrane subunit [Thermodesulfovibrionia bacterium]